MTKGWKEFEIKQLFDCVLSKGDLKEENSEEGDIPLVSSGAQDNGIVKYINKDGDGKAQIFDGNCLTLDMFCNCFYQPINFYSVSHGRVNILIPKFKMNREIGLFLCAIINLQKYKYSYGRAIYSSVAEKMIIKLPVDDNNIPNWCYMETFISNIENRERESEGSIANSIKTTNINSKLKLNRQNWKIFKINDLFEVETGGDILPLEEQDGNVPVICLGWEDNGLCMTIDKNSKHPLYKKGTMTVAGWAGGLKAFYQPEDYYVKGRIKICIPKFNMTIYSCLFICTVINYNSYLFSYGRKASGNKFLNIELKLPSDSDGNLDIKYMENYIKSLPYADRI